MVYTFGMVESPRMEVAPMPWKVDRVMAQRDDLCMQVRIGKRSVTEVAQVYGVSRATAHKWLKRWDE